MHTNPGAKTADRAAQRREYLDRLLGPVGLSLDDLATSTRRALHEYARFMLVVARAQSASWNMGVMELCRAVEYEIAATLRDCPGLANFGKRTLGEQASVLRSLPPAAVNWLSSRRYLPYISKTLPNRLFDLARGRGDSGAAHGGPEVREATPADHKRILTIALIGSEAIIPSLARLRRQARQGR
jgi:hypothetical protein